jgi:hypothetical protein
MHVFLEFWSPKPSWLAMSTERRQAFMGGMGALTSPVVNTGAIEVLGWGVSDPVVDHPEPHQFFAVWRAPTRKALDELRAAITKGGWYEHFDQVNVTGELSTVDAIIGQHIAM